MRLARHKELVLVHEKRAIYVAAHVFVLCQRMLLVVDGTSLRGLLRGRVLPQTLVFHGDARLGWHRQLE